MEVSEAEAHDAVRTLIRWIGDDPNREGLQGTPGRVAKAWRQICSGYKDDPERVLSKSFATGGYDEVIALGPIEFWSTCEHHMLPFFGHATVAYIPAEGQRVVGISKLARVVDVFAKRLQIQEEMTKQIADSVVAALSPAGVGVVVKARHLCMACRGVGKQQPSMVTSVMTGIFRENQAARSELLSVIENGARQ